MSPARTRTRGDPILLTVMTAPHILAAQEKPTRWTPEVMIHFKRVGGIAVSPDGRMVHPLPEETVGRLRALFVLT